VEQTLQRLQDKCSQGQVTDFLHFKIPIQLLKLMIKLECGVQLLKHN